MTNQQVKEAINAAIQHFSELQQAKMQLIINNLENIDAKITRQNGTVSDTVKRVSELEKVTTVHALTCPHTQTIMELRARQHELANIKKSVRNWIIIATAIINTLVALILHFLP
ncbi:MAG: hypothetical protein LWX09_12545 [Bacteroidia bacterium]|nr:hypothetical protein [Bacteroidia bacterium]